VTLVGAPGEKLDAFFIRPTPPLLAKLNTNPEPETLNPEHETEEEEEEEERV